MIGSSIGPYRIDGLLGSGGMGHVYVALDQDLGRRVALKALRPEYSDDPDLLERFRNEASSLARLRHPNITMLYSLFRQDDAGRQNTFMVMELVEGETLEGLLRRQGRISVRAAVAVMAQAALGLSYAHGCGVVHRDIKPSNLMLGSDGLLKIMDFGIARVQGSERLTRQGNLVGTLSYIAPEQIKGEEADERSDLYSLACVFYELLSGEKPFVGATDYELIRAQLEGEPRPLTDVMPELEPRIAQAIRRALAKEPGERFASVAAFAEAIGATAGENAATTVLEELPAAAPARPQTVMPDAELSPVAATLATRVLPGVLAPAGTPPPAPRLGRRRGLMVATACAAVALSLAAGGYVVHAARQAPIPAATSPGGHAQEAGKPAEAAAVAVAPDPEPMAPPQPADSAPPEALASAAPPAPEQSTESPPPEPVVPAPAPVQEAGTLAGTVSSYTTEGWPVINGVTLHLEGVEALAPGELKPVATWIAAHGNYLACTAAPSGTYRCLTRERLDLAQAILLNGAARASSGTRPIYRDAEAQARMARRGFWK